MAPFHFICFPLLLSMLLLCVAARYTRVEREGESGIGRSSDCPSGIRLVLQSLSLVYSARGCPPEVTVGSQLKANLGGSSRLSISSKLKESAG